MLVNQVQDTFGSSGLSVNLQTQSFLSQASSGTVFNGLELNSNGIASRVTQPGGTSQLSGQWLVTGLNTNYWVRYNIVSGTLNAATPPTENTWVPMTSTYDFQNSLSTPDVISTVVFYEFATDSGGVNIILDATHTYVTAKLGGE